MATEITTDRLRALAATRSPEGKVLSLFVNLDPQQFPTPGARATEVRSVLDATGKAIREQEGSLTAAERTALDADLERVRGYLESGEARLEASGARGLAVFASEPAELFEVLALPRSVGRDVRIADRPAIATISRLASTAPWWLLLADRRHARLLSGDLDGIAEHWRAEHELAGQRDQSPSSARDQSGTSHERKQRSADKDVSDHLREVVAEVRRQLDGKELAGILLSGPGDIVPQLRDLLPTELARKVKAEFDVDVWSSSPAQVLKAAAPTIERLEQELDDRLLDSLSDAIGTGRGAGGLADVLAAINERRINKLAILHGTSAHGVRCPACGWLGLSASAGCPGCATMTESIDDIVEEAAARTLEHGGDVHVFLPGKGRLGPYDGIAATLRF